jgi:hypothetical protein
MKVQTLSATPRSLDGRESRGSRTRGALQAEIFIQHFQVSTPRLYLVFAASVENGQFLMHGEERGNCALDVDPLVELILRGVIVPEEVNSLGKEVKGHRDARLNVLCPLE